MSLYKKKFLFFLQICFYISCSHQTPSPSDNKKMKDEVQGLINQKILVKKNIKPERPSTKTNAGTKITSAVQQPAKKKLEEKMIVRVISDSVQSTPVYLDKWRQKSELVYQNEIKKYKVKLMGINMGELSLTTKTSPMEDYFYLKGHLKNKSFYKYLYSINDLLEAKVLKDGLRVVQVDMSKNENGASSLSVQRTLNKEVVFVEKTIKKKKKSKKERVVKFDKYYFDPLSFIKLVELVDIVNLKNNKVPVIFRGKLYFMKVKEAKTVNRKQTIYFDTYRNGKIKKDQKIVFIKRLGDHPKIIKLRGKIKVGELEGELIE